MSSTQTTSIQSDQRRWYLIEILLIITWTVWVGRAYLNFDPHMWPFGREFGMSIHPHFVWTQLWECGTCVLWNGAFNGGSPTFVELHAAIAHPLVIVSTLVWGAVNGAKMILLGSLLMAGLAQWWLARVAGIQMLGRVWGACLVVSAGHLAGKMEHGIVPLMLSTAACSLVIAPLLKVGLHGRQRDAVILGVVLALAIVSGQGYLQIALGVAVIPLFSLFVVDDAGEVRPNIQQYLLSFTLALLLAAVFLVPLIHFFPQFGKELDQTFDSAQPLAYIPLNFVTDDEALYRSDVLGKQPFGYLYINYVGWIPVLLAFIGGRRFANERRKLFWLATLGIGATLFVASALPFMWLSRFADGLASQVRNAPVMAGLAVPFLILLASRGLDALQVHVWPTLSLTQSEGGRTVHLNLKYVVIVLLCGWSLNSTYEFSRNWLHMLPSSAETIPMITSISNEQSQWVALPLGEHFLAPVAAEAGLKTTDQVRPARWHAREEPLPSIQGNRNEPVESAETWEISGVFFGVLPDNQYAYVLAGGEKIPCVAHANHGTIDVECTTTVAGILLVEENSWSGWRARIDGQRVPLEREQWLAVQAPAGQHTYQFRYLPWDVVIGSLFTLAGIVLAAYWWQPRQ